MRTVCHFFYGLKGNMRRGGYNIIWKVIRRAEAESRIANRYSVHSKESETYISIGWGEIESVGNSGKITLKCAVYRQNSKLDLGKDDVES